MGQQDIREEALSNILEEMDIKLTKEQISTIAKDFADGLEMEREMYATPFINSKPVCEECKRLKSQLNQFEAKENRLRKYYSYDGRGNVNVKKTEFLNEYFGF